MTDYLINARTACTGLLEATGELQRQATSIETGSGTDIRALLEAARHAAITAQNNLEAIEKIMLRDADCLSYAETRPHEP